MTVLDVLQSSPPLAISLAFIFGTFIGSFLNVVIYRLPLMLEREWKKQCAEILSPSPSGVSPDGPSQSASAGLLSSGSSVTSPAPERFDLLVPRSRCPVCQAPIRAWHNIPILGYFLLRGRCADCGKRISPRYPGIELLTGLLTAAVVWKFGFGWEAAGALAITWSLIALSAIDLDHQLLPDGLTLPLLWAGLLFAALFADSTESALSIPAATLSSSVIGAAAGYLSLWSIYQAFKLLTGKEGMGYGDFKLLAAFGAWFGWQMLLPIVLLSAFTGAAVGIALIALRKHSREIPIPFGPYLAAAGWIALMWGPELLARYLHLAKL